MAWTSRSPFPQEAEVDRMKLQQLSREEYQTHERLGSPGKAPVGGHTAVPSDPYRGRSYSPSGLNRVPGCRGAGGQGARKPTALLCAILYGSCAS